MEHQNLLVIGCGQLGSRHLQAVSALNEIAEIHVVDPSEASQQLGKIRLDEVKEANPAAKVYWHERFNAKIPPCSIGIVATQAKNRLEVVREAFERLGIVRFLIEKIVSQSVREYNEFIEFSRQNSLSIWVNCQLRTFSVYKFVKSKLSANDHISFARIGGNKGLANNGVHTADLFLYLDDSSKLHLCGDRINNDLHQSKRSSEIFDLSGNLYGYTDKGSDFVLSFSGSSDSPAHITIVSKNYKFIINHLQKWAYVSSRDRNWQWRSIPIDDNLMVSHTTKTYIRDILQRNDCELPTLSICYPAHQFILDALRPHFNRLMDNNDQRLPVT